MIRQHALVIGGTGMLRDVSLWFTEIGHKVSVIGRSERKHMDMIKSSKYPELLNGLMVDYYNLSSLEKSVRHAISEYGPISTLVSWTPSLPSLELVSSIISEQSTTWKLYQVKGSRRYFKDEILTLPSNCEHRSIYLGFILEEDHSRWLTNTEISKGVIQCVKGDRVESIIGRVEPYEKRP